LQISSKRSQLLLECQKIMTFADFFEAEFSPGFSPDGGKLSPGFPQVSRSFPQVWLSFPQVSTKTLGIEEFLGIICFLTCAQAQDR
jgi:hypothetical protein